MDILLSIMASKSTSTLPSLKRALSEMGENIRLARLRRKIPATLLSQRAGMTRVTLRRVERGDPGTAMGAYATVLLSLGLQSDLTLVARDDILGRKLQDAGLLSPKKRVPKRKL